MRSARGKYDRHESWAPPAQGRRGPGERWWFLGLVQSQFTDRHKAGGVKTALSLINHVTAWPLVLKPLDALLGNLRLVNVHTHQIWKLLEAF